MIAPAEGERTTRHVDRLAFLSALRALATRLLAVCGPSVVCGFALSIATAGAWAEAPLGEGVRRLDGVAAVVGGLAPGQGVITILRSDVELRARMALLREGSGDAALRSVPQGLLRASLSELLGEALIAWEAKRLNLEPPSPEALRAERDRLLGAGDAARTRSLLKALGVSERELRAWIERRATVSGFLEANLEGTLDISPGELARAFETESHPFREQPFEEVEERFAAWLTQQRLQRAVGRWVESLRQRVPHRVLHDS